ncbi:MAG: TetR/AcrR family transcriptional regulator [Bacteroidales bacterium]|nr:TetR/AcrR family transcriptional regulator [Bacteroidales bacterium]
MASQNQIPPSNPSRAVQKQVTRKKLIDATVQVIAEQGIAGVTLAKVAKRTGLSQGICNFHFKTKKLLLLEAFRMLYSEHEAAWRSILSDSSKSPESRLQILVRTILTPPIADHTKLAVWMSFWGVTPHRQTYLEICGKLDREYETEVENLIRKMAKGQETINGMSLKAIAVTLTAMMDGFWVNYLISPGCLPREDAVNACLNFLSGFFPSINSMED